MEIVAFKRGDRFLEVVYVNLHAGNHRDILFREVDREVAIRRGMAVLSLEKPIAITSTPIGEKQPRRPRPSFATFMQDGRTVIIASTQYKGPALLAKARKKLGLT